MDWLQRSVGLNSSLPAAWESLVAAVTDQSQAWSKVLVERVVVPLGSCLLHQTERLVQYTLNGEYEAVQDATRSTLATALSWLDLTTFQVKLLREFFVIFLGNSLLVLLAWRIYGARIRARSGGRKNIQELRTSVSELKLPREMDFKCK